MTFQSPEKPSSKKGDAVTALKKLGEDVADTGAGIFDAFKKAEPAEQAVMVGAIIGATALILNSDEKSGSDENNKPQEENEAPRQSSIQSRAQLKTAVDSKIAHQEQAQPKPKPATKPASRKLEVISGRSYLVGKDKKVSEELPPDLYKKIMSEIPEGIRGTPAGIVKAAELCRKYYIIGAYCGEWVRVVYEIAGVKYKEKKFDSMPDYTKYDKNGEKVRNPDCGIHHLIPQKTAEYIKLGHNPDAARSMAIKFAQRELKVGSHVITNNGSPDLWGSHAEIITRVIDPKNFLYEVMGYPGKGRPPRIRNKYLGPNPDNSSYARVVRFYNPKE